MTYSPQVSAAGTVPDPRPAPEPETAPADYATDPGQAGYATDPGQGYATDPGAGYATDGRQAGRAAGAGQAADTELADDAGTGQAGYVAEPGEDGDPGAAWPHQSFLELGALPTAAPCARLHTTLVLWEWGLGALVQTAALVVSELVSNAVQASRGLTGSRFAGQWAPGTPPVRMWLSADDRRVVIQVWDGSYRPPVPQAVEPEADCGRGLLLVGSLSTEWGCYTPEQCSGKVVWSVVTG